MVLQVVIFLMSDAISNKSRVIVWFRNDLRSHDHEALHRAVQTGAVIVPVYCFDPRQFEQTSFGFPKTGRFRAEFLLASLRDLRTSLENLGSSLVIRRGMPELIIPELAQEIRASAVYFHEETTFEEIKVEAKLIANLKKLGIDSQSFWGHTLYHLDDLPFDINQLPELFTSFRKEVEKSCAVNSLFPQPSKLLSLGELAVGEIPTMADLGLGAAIADQRAVMPFTGGESAGLARLDYYFWQSDLIATYKETRNGMLGGDYSSKFSPWLALGCLSPRYIYSQVQQYERERRANDSTYWLVFELLWRDYFRFIAAKHGDRLFKISGLQGINLPWSEDLEQFQLWQSGRTGFPLIDANMQELAVTGFMSNRGRQNVASFLTKNMGINWQIGAEWFESILIDYDVCSNWGNWNYTAGVGNDARGFRYFNILKQANDYDPEGKYVKHWLPALQSVPVTKIHTPWKSMEMAGDYPRPILDLEYSVKINEKAYNSALAIDKNSSKKSKFRR